MLFKAYQTLTEYNQTGLQAPITYVATVVPLFIPLTLFVFFMIIALSTYFSRTRFTGRSNIFESAAVAGYATTILAFSMTLLPNLINTLTLVVCVVVSIVFTILLYFSKE